MVILEMCCYGADNIIPLLSQDYPNQTVLKSDFIIILGGEKLPQNTPQQHTTTIEAQFMTVHRHRVGSLRPFHPGSAMVRQQ